MIGDAPDDIRIEVDRPRFSMRVYVWSYRKRRYVRRQTFKITLGALNFSTPPGPYKIMGKTRTPDWAPPDWAEIEEEVIPFVCPRCSGKKIVVDFEAQHLDATVECPECGGTGENPKNPFEGGFVSLGGHPSTRGDGIGIHGTKFDPQTGTRASHGCIRMATADLLSFWKYASLGTPVTVYGDQ
jgi:predicted RNA-binding Zn-ribbon protein involved in translation (DUF1610 family)